jgi:hypothetical protein
MISRPLEVTIYKHHLAPIADKPIDKGPVADIKPIDKAVDIKPIDKPIERAAERAESRSVGSEVGVEEFRKNFTGISREFDRNCMYL